MRAPWGFLRQLPPGLLTWIKRHSHPGFRLWIRETFGGSYKTIPDMVQTIPDGRRFRIGPELIYWPLYTGLGFEPEATDIIRHLLRPDDVVLDVGANFGWYSSLFAAVAWNGRTYAFEPVPETFERLVENLALNGVKARVRAVQAAVSDSFGTSTIFKFAEGSGLSSLSSLGEEICDKIEVRTIALDRYLSDEGMAKVDFLKCDSEGSELMVLRGAHGLLSSPDAPVIFLELNDRTFSAFGYSKEDVRRYLVDHGYDHFYEIISARSLRRLSAPRPFAAADAALCAKGSAVVDRLAGSGIRVN